MFHRLTCSVRSEVCNPSCFRSYYSNHNVVSSWLLLYVFIKAKHKTHEMITQTQKDSSSCFNDVMQLQRPVHTRPEWIAIGSRSSCQCGQASSPSRHRSLWTVCGRFRRQKTANSKQHRVRLHSVSVVTRAHNARSYDVDHGCMKSMPVDVNVPAAAFNRCCRHADFTNSNDSSSSLRVVLYETREAN